MSDIRNVCVVICIGLVSLLPVFSVGCAQQKAVDLYVDAVMYREQDENEKAIEKLNSAVKANRKFSIAYSLLGEIYQEINDYEKSAASYEKATELNPWSFKDYFNLGGVYHLMKRFTEAIRAYTRACELEPDHFK
ncbi:MAG: tetratricopeptide repeat protein, partial [Planctomycetota bacterium]